MSTLVDLVMDNGELVRIECPEQFEDAFYDSLQHTMKRGDWWATGQFDGCKAEYMGMYLDRVNMKRVVGVM